MTVVSRLDQRLEKLEKLPEQLHKLEHLPSAIDNLCTAIEAHTKVFSSSVPLSVVRWIFLIVVILIGGRWGLLQLEKFLD